MLSNLCLNNNNTSILSDSSVIIVGKGEDS